MAMRRLMLVLVLVAAAGCASSLRDDGEPLEPLDPYDLVIQALDDFPVIALGEYHLMEQWHEYMHELLQRDEFIDRVDDVVVEFGNALHQDVADRFVVGLEDVPFDELAPIWRDAGSVLWDAPIYEEFFRQVRAVNESLPPEKRLRVLLGNPAVDYRKIRSAADAAETEKGVRGDAHYAELVEREVLAKDRRAALVYGADHVRREVHANTGPRDPNAVTLLERRHPGSVYVIYPLPFLERDSVEIADLLEDDLHRWARPSIAQVGGTWLGAQPFEYRSLEPGSTVADQVDAVIWFGPRSELSASRPDPAIYQSGPYADELDRRSAIMSEYLGEPVDYADEGLRLAMSEPRL